MPIDLESIPAPNRTLGQSWDTLAQVSIDLSRPLVPSEGNLDPFDGLVTYRLLRDATGGRSVLDAEIADMERIVAAKYPGETWEG